jgi:hypothetical protein
VIVAAYPIVITDRLRPAADVVEQIDPAPGWCDRYL